MFVLDQVATGFAAQPSYPNNTTARTTVKIYRNQSLFINLINRLFIPRFWDSLIPFVRCRGMFHHLSELFNLVESFLLRRRASLAWRNPAELCGLTGQNGVVARP